jgi:GAF domain-containing protein
VSDAEPAEPTRLTDPGGEAVLLQAAVDEAARLLAADGGMIYLLDESGRELRFAFDAGITDRRRRAWVRRLRLPLGVGMFGRAVAERRVVSTADYMTDTSFAHTPAADRVVRVVGMRSMVVAPLIAGDSILGALGVFHGQPEAVGEPEIALVRALADHAAAAIANLRLIADLARSREAAARRAETERTLREIAARITAVRDPTAILHLIAAEAARILGHDRVSSTCPTTDRRHRLTWYSRPRSGDDWPPRPSRRGGCVGKAIAERRPFITGDYLADDRFTIARGPIGKAESGAPPWRRRWSPGQPLGAMLVEAPEKDAPTRRTATSTRCPPGGSFGDAHSSISWSAPASCVRAEERRCRDARSRPSATRPSCSRGSSARPPGCSGRRGRRSTWSTPSAASPSGSTRRAPRARAPRVGSRTAGCPAGRSGPVARSGPATTGPIARSVTRAPPMPSCAPPACVRSSRHRSSATRGCSA